MLNYKVTYIDLVFFLHVYLKNDQDKCLTLKFSCIGVCYMTMAEL